MLNLSSPEMNLGTISRVNVVSANVMSRRHYNHTRKVGMHFQIWNFLSSRTKIVFHALISSFFFFFTFLIDCIYC